MNAKVLNEHFVVSSLLCLLPLAMGLLLYDKIPAEMPIHWDNRGSADGVVAKQLGIWMVPLFILAVHIVVSVGTAIKSRRQQLAKMTLWVSQWAVPLIAVIIEPAAFLKAAGYSLDMTRLVFSLVGIVFVIAGNYMPKNQPNAAAGYRFSWILNDVNIWKRTHLLAGKLWVLVGFIMMLCGWTNIGDSWLLIVLVLCALMLPVAFSLLMRNKQLKQGR